MNLHQLWVDVAFSTFISTSSSTRVTVSHLHEKYASFHTHHTRVLFLNNKGIKWTAEYLVSYIRIQYTASQVICTGETQWISITHSTHAHTYIHTHTLDIRVCISSWYSVALSHTVWVSFVLLANQSQISRFRVSSLPLRVAVSVPLHNKTFQYLIYFGH